MKSYSILTINIKNSYVFSHRNFFLYLTKQEKYIFLYLLFIQEWTVANLLIFSLLDIKLCFSGLLVRNAKLVSFFC